MTIQNALLDCSVAKLLHECLSTHIDKSGSNKLSILLLGASTPNLARALLAQCARCEVSVTMHLIDTESEAIDRVQASLSSDCRELLSVTRTSPADLKVNPAVLEDQLATAGCPDLSALRALNLIVEQQALTAPMIASNNVDIVIMDMLLNRMTPDEGERATAEAFRVLKRNGLLLMTVLLADESLSPVLPMKMGDWRAVRFPMETEVVKKLEHTGFHGMRYLNCEMPKTIVHGNVELGAFLIDARKGKQGVCLDQGHAVIFRGPWREAYDDDGHRYGRGERTAVCAKTYALPHPAAIRRIFHWATFTRRTAAGVRSYI